MSRLRPKFCLNYLASVSKRASSLSSPQSKLNRHNPTRQLLRAAILWALVAGGVVIAPKSSFAQVRQVCYAIADGGRLDPVADPGGGGTTDVLVQFSDSAADPVVNVGNIGTLDIESMAVQPSTGQIFAVDGGTLGTVNPATGAFTIIGDSGLGDIDGLSFNPATGELFASVRDGAQDQLVQLNPATGAVSVAAVNIDTSGLAGLDDIDGITWDPTGATLFGIANQGATSDQRLITINPTTGAVTDVGSFGIDDVEDLSFDRLGNLRAVTGTSLAGADGEQVWTVNQGTGAATAIRNIEIPGVAVDYEALDCIRLPVIDLALAKAVTPATAAPGATVTYTITVGNNAAVGTNAGGLPNIDDAEDVIVTDALPAGLTLSTTTAPVPSQGTYNSATGEWSVGNLADGATATLTITATVDAATASGTINNFAQVTQDRDPTDPLSDVVFFPGVDPFDIDSFPNNGTSPTPVEDDEGTAPLVIDAGLTLGNVIFEDLNGNGVQDLGEPGVAGATVTLLDADNGNAVVGTPVTTIADGAYSFTGLAAGNYIVQVTSPAGFAPTLQDQGGDDATDSDIDTTTGQTAVIALAANDDTQDAGLIQPASVGDTVFLDVDGSNTFNAGDTPIQGVTVTLQDSAGAAVTDAAGNAVAPATTDASGNYLFSNLRPGDYQVIFSGAPVANGFVTADQGGDDTIDSDADATGTISGITLTSGQADTTRDAGIVDVPGFTLGNIIFEDLDGDGVQDLGEPGVAGATVTLLDADNGNAVVGTPITTTSTGAYSFTGLAAGNYIVQVTSPAGFAPTLQDQGGDDATDSDIDTTTGQTAVIALAADDNTQDAGLIQPASVGDTVFLDVDGSNTFNAGDTPIQGVTVTLQDSAGAAVTDAAGNVVAPATTDASGNYLFSNLRPGDYQVIFSGAPVANGFVTADQGGDDTLDSDADATGTISGITLVSGQVDPTRDAGIVDVPGLTIGNVIFEDLNGNGVQDLGEPGVTGATVTLLDADNGNAVVGTPITTTSTGAYSFTGLAAGNYIVQVTSPAGFAPTLQDQGGDDATDSDIDTTTGQTAVIALAADDNTQDAGLIQPASVGDTVFLDVDGSNTFNAGDTPIQGVTVTLQDSAGAAVTDAAGNVVAPATTDASGNYLFSNLRPGDYQVIFSGTPVANGFVAADQGVDDAADSDADATGTISGITLVSGQVDPTRDAGIVPGATGTIGDVVFLDSDNDGIQDLGEPGLAGIVVTLLDANGNPASDASGNPIAPITTDASGTYSFTDLPPGPYQISFDGSSQQLGLTQANQGADDTVDSDADPATGLITGISLAAGETLSNLDAGFVGASLGSLVFTDTDGDGIQDPGEPGQAGVIVTLEDENGNPVVDLAGNPVQPITTDATGIYSFTNLPPGNFQVRFDPGSTGLIFSTQDAGADDTVDSDVDPDTGLISGVTLAVGQNLPDLDAGLQPAPQLTLVKRITAVRRNGVALAVPGANFNGVELDNPTLGDAPLTAATLAQFDAVGLSPVGVQSLSDATELLPGDEVEYTIYFISSGQGTVGNAEVCDVLADRLDFSETGGITITGAADSSAFLGGLVTVPTGTGAGRSCNVSQLGQQGAVVAELGDLAANEFGSVTFSAFIDAEQ